MHHATCIPPPACPAAPRCATSPASSAPSRPPSPPRPRGWPPPLSAGTMNLLQKKSQWWFIPVMVLCSSEQSHTFLFFSCETLPPNPKLAQVLRPDFFLFEQRIVSTGEKFYSKYTIRSIVCEASCHSVTWSLGHSVTWSHGHSVTRSLGHSLT